MPVTVFGVGIFFGTETYKGSTLLNMCVVTLGVVIASMGEINFVVVGVLLQLTSIVLEAMRLTMVQVRLIGYARDRLVATLPWQLCRWSYHLVSCAALNGAADPSLVVLPLPCSCCCRRSPG